MSTRTYDGPAEERWADWIEHACAALGLDPEAVDVRSILAMTKTIAHDFERPMAPVGAYIAMEKARSAALGRRETKAYEDMINGGRTAFVAVADISRGLLEGGVPLIVDGDCIGAVGVSGVKADQDAQVARAGTAAIL